MVRRMGRRRDPARCDRCDAAPASLAARARRRSSASASSARCRSPTRASRNGSSVNMCMVLMDTGGLRGQASFAVLNSSLVLRPKGDQTHSAYLRTQSSAAHPLRGCRVGGPQSDGSCRARRSRPETPQGSAHDNDLSSIYAWGSRAIDQKGIRLCGSTPASMTRKP
jgi:hypothetical protein